MFGNPDCGPRSLPLPFSLDIMKIHLTKTKPALGTVQRQALRRRLQRRIACEGKIVLPAVPGMLDDYLSRCEQTFSAVGRDLSDTERHRLRDALAEQLTKAFAGSQRATITISYSAAIERPLSYTVTAQCPDIAQTYEAWIGTRAEPYFGHYADARVLTAAKRLERTPRPPVLDIGAGTGRNTLALARLGHRVDAVELTPKFATSLIAAARDESLPVRVICENIFTCGHLLRRDYALVLVSEVTSDFRSVEEWRALLELSAGCLAEGGQLVVNAFVAGERYSDEAAAREFAQHAYSFFMLPSEVRSACNGLPLELATEEDVHDYEKSHLPEGAWPPTPWYSNWVSGRDVFDLPKDSSPINMRWLVFQKTTSR